MYSCTCMEAHIYRHPYMQLIHGMVADNVSVYLQYEVKLLKEVSEILGIGF